MALKAKWTGSLFFTNGWAHYHGPAGDGTFHAHFLHQLIFSKTETITVALKGAEPLIGRTLFVPSNTQHLMHVCEDHLDILYIEPSVHDKTAPKGATLEQWIKALSAPKQKLYDTRIETALSLIDNILPDKVYAKDIAKEAGLSISHFHALFRAGTTIPLRRYVLWRRLNIAGLVMANGGDLTVAAHRAGFSDSAHFSRTVTKTFGISPSGGFQSLNITVSPNVAALAY